MPSFRSIGLGGVVVFVVSLVLMMVSKRTPYRLVLRGEDAVEPAPAVASSAAPVVIISYVVESVSWLGLCIIGLLYYVYCRLGNFLLSLRYCTVL